MSLDLSAVTAWYPTLSRGASVLGNGYPEANTSISRHATQEGLARVSMRR
jgi:hypothetical protein